MWKNLNQRYRFVSAAILAASGLLTIHFATASRPGSRSWRGSSVPQAADY
jgi:hypothetical protein